MSFVTAREDFSHNDSSTTCTFTDIYSTAQSTFLEVGSLADVGCSSVDFSTIRQDSSIPRNLLEGERIQGLPATQLPGKHVVHQLITAAILVPSDSLNFLHTCPGLARYEPSHDRHEVAPTGKLVSKG